MPCIHNHLIVLVHRFIQLLNFDVVLNIFNRIDQWYMCLKNTGGQNDRSNKWKCDFNKSNPVGVTSGRPQRDNLQVVLVTQRKDITSLGPLETILSRSTSNLLCPDRMYKETSSHGFEGFISRFYFLKKKQECFPKV